MLTRRVIPCLDVLDGRVVKGRKFEALIDVGDPVELSARYSGEGADELVLLDIRATIEQRGPFLEVVERVAKRVAIPLTVGGGIRNLDDILSLLRSGADKVSLNTVLVDDPGLLARAAARVGTQALVAAIDVRRGLGPPALDRPQAPFTRPGEPVVDAGHWLIYTRSGTEETRLDAIEWAKKVTGLGAGELLVTSIDHDGMKRGYDLEFLRELRRWVNVPVIASGGAGSREQIAEALTIGKADAVLAASVFHFNEISISDLKRYLQLKGLPVRL
jgi:cyclase